MSSSQVCPTCSKKVYPTEKVEANKDWYHKPCFKCSTAGCKASLTIQNFLVSDSMLYCPKHVPKVKATAITDSLDMRAAKGTPKVIAEGLHRQTVASAPLRDRSRSPGSSPRASLDKPPGSSGLARASRSPPLAPQLKVEEASMGADEEHAEVHEEQEYVEINKEVLDEEEH